MFQVLETVKVVLAFEEEDKANQFASEYINRRQLGTSSSEAFFQ